MRKENIITIAIVCAFFLIASGYNMVQYFIVKPHKESIGNLHLKAVFDGIDNTGYLKEHLKEGWQVPEGWNHEGRIGDMPVLEYSYDVGFFDNEEYITFYIELLWDTYHDKSDFCKAILDLNSSMFPNASQYGHIYNNLDEGGLSCNLFVGDGEYNYSIDIR